jgi:hypothetical protein
MTENRLKTIHGWDEVPDFENEQEEHEFWGSHSFSEEMLEDFRPPYKGELPPPRPETKTRPRRDRLTLDVEKDLAKRLKNLADVKGVGYRALLRQFIAERVYEEEKREGMLK